MIRRIDPKAHGVGQSVQDLAEHLVEDLNIASESGLEAATDRMALALQQAFEDEYEALEAELRPDAADCKTCDGYVLSASEAPFCPSCARERANAR